MCGRSPKKFESANWIHKSTKTLVFFSFTFFVHIKTTSYHFFSNLYIIHNVSITDFFLLLQWRQLLEGPYTTDIILFFIIKIPNILYDVNLIQFLNFQMIQTNAPQRIWNIGKILLLNTIDFSHHNTRLRFLILKSNLFANHLTKGDLMLQSVVFPHSIIFLTHLTKL